MLFGVQITQNVPMKLLIKVCIIFRNNYEYKLVLQ